MNHPRKILFVIEELEVGGAQRQILLLGRTFRALGHSVAVVWFQQEGAVILPALEAAGFETLPVPKRRRIDPAFFLRLARLLLRERHSLLLSFNYTANLWCRLAAPPLARLRQISCIRDIAYLPAVPGLLGRALGWLERILALRSHRVVANSQATADSLLARGLVPAWKLRVVPNGVDASALAPRPEARARLTGIVGLPDPGLLVGTLARLVAVKELTTLMRAAAIVLRDDPRVRFILGGEGPERRALEGLRDELGIRDRVHLPGTLDGAAVVAGLDVSVLTSRREGMPNFILESMCAGVPVVSTRVGAVPDMLDDGALGRLIEPGDAEGLAAAILEVLKDPAAYRAMAERAAAKAKGMVAGPVAERYLALFKESEA